jgi:prevent-host-death family protein
MKIAMSEVSIAEARDTLTRLIQKAEAGETVHITRRGKPVAVLVSEADYARLKPRRPRQSFTEFLEKWRAEIAKHPEDAPRGDEFENVRNYEESPNRKIDFE